MRRGRTVASILGLAAAECLGAAIALPQVPEGVVLVGRVLDEALNAIEGVEVLVNRVHIRARTGVDGRFSVWIFPSDSTVGFRKIGYKPLLLSLRPKPSPRDTVLVELRSSAVELPELIVSAAPSKPLRYAGTSKYDDVFHRQRVGLGTLIPREAIEQRFGSTTAELLQGIPGVTVWNGPPKRIRFARCQDPGGIMIYIDGVPQRSMFKDHPSGGQVFRSGRSARNLGDSPEIEMLSRVHPSEIEMIEVFRGVSEIPGVFHWDGCAVIAVWTKWNR